MINLHFAVPDMVAVLMKMNGGVSRFVYVNEIGVIRLLDEMIGSQAEDEQKLRWQVVEMKVGERRQLERGA